MTRITIIGAGCFGAWTAHWLATQGHAVTLVDAYGPGNSRASSGGETRIIRMAYGPQAIYTRWSARSLDHWKTLAQHTGDALFVKTGVLTLASGGDQLARATLDTLRDAGVPHERLDSAQLRGRWPQVDVPADSWAIHEPESGVLMARRAVGAVVRRATARGVQYVRASAGAPAGSGRLATITTSSGDISADVFVFTCGPWLPALFPDVLGGRIFPTRQEVLYFGPPAGDRRFTPPAMPVWIDFANGIYAIPDIESRGYKIALDRHGPPFDPEMGDRTQLTSVAEVRAFLARHLPALADAPLVAFEVCQYENTSNGDFLIDRHPHFDNVWLVGGGSGHGFKHGPALGEYVADLVMHAGAADDRFRLVTKQNVKQRAIF